MLLTKCRRRPATKYFTDVAKPMLEQVGDDLPVSAFVGREDGTMPSGTSKFEKAGPALHVPSWDNEKCIGCSSVPSFARMLRFVRA